MGIRDTDINAEVEGNLGNVVKSAGPNSMTHIRDLDHSTETLKFYGAAADEMVAAAKENGAQLVMGFEVESKYQNQQTGRIDYNSLQSSGSYPVEIIDSIKQAENAGAEVVLMDKDIEGDKARLGAQIYESTATTETGASQARIENANSKIANLSDAEKEEATDAFLEQRGRANGDWTTAMENGVKRVKEKHGENTPVQTVDMGGDAHFDQLGGHRAFDQQMADRMPAHGINSSTYASAGNSQTTGFSGAQPDLKVRTNAQGVISTTETTAIGVPTEQYASAADPQGRDSFAQSKDLVRVVPRESQPKPERKVISLSDTQQQPVQQQPTQPQPATPEVASTQPEQTQTQSQPTRSRLSVDGQGNVTRTEASAQPAQPRTRISVDGQGNVKKVNVTEQSQPQPQQPVASTSQKPEPTSTQPAQPQQQTVASTNGTQPPEPAQSQPQPQEPLSPMAKAMAQVKERDAGLGNRAQSDGQNIENGTQVRDQSRDVAAKAPAAKK